MIKKFFSISAFYFRGRCEVLITVELFSYFIIEYTLPCGSEWYGDGL